MVYPKTHVCLALLENNIFQLFRKEQKTIVLMQCFIAINQSMLSSLLYRTLFLQILLMNIIFSPFLKSLIYRCSWETEWSLLWLLSRALPRCHFSHQNQTKNAVLFFQFNCTLCSNSFNGCTGIYTSSWFRGETVTW